MAAETVTEMTSRVTQLQASSYLVGRADHASVEERSESTLYFNDGVGRLTEFHMEQAGQVMTLTIRQNMNIVWQGHTSVEQNCFSVAREERQGTVYFRIRMGNKEYKAFSDAKDHWNVVEIKGNDALADEVPQVVQL